MGADGGSFLHRSELVKTKAKAEQKDEKSLLKALWFYCALSRKPLTPPVVADPLGKLYNKDAIIEYLLDRTKYGDGDQICGYVKGVKDLLNLTLTPNPSNTSPPPPSSVADLPPHAPFICPLTLKEMSGSLPFVALRTCGCVFTEAGLKSVIQAVEGERTPPSEGEDGSERTIPCPNCNKPFNTGGEKGKLPWLTLNPRPEVQELMLERLLEERAAAKMAKKEKDGNGKKRKSTNPESDPTLIREEVHYSSKRLKTPIAHATTQSHLSHKVAQQLADLEAKRKEGGMSAAVASIYEGKGQMAGDRKRNAGNDFFTRTYTRYA